MISIAPKIPGNPANQLNIPIHQGITESTIIAVPFSRFSESLGLLEIPELQIISAIKVGTRRIAVIITPNFFHPFLKTA